MSAVDTVDRNVTPRVGESETWRPSPQQRALLANLVIEFGVDPFTSARAAALLGRHVQGVGTFLGRAARSGELIPTATGSVQLRRVREVNGGRSLWGFEFVVAGRSDHAEVQQLATRDAAPDVDADIL